MTFDDRDYPITYESLGSIQLDHNAEVQEAHRKINTAMGD